MKIEQINLIIQYCKGFDVKKVWVELNTGTLMPVEANSGPCSFPGQQWKIFDMEKLNDFTA